MTKPRRRFRTHNPFVSHKRSVQRTARQNFLSTGIAIDLNN